MNEALFPKDDLDTILSMIDVAVAMGDEESTLQLCEAAQEIAPDDLDVLLARAAVLRDLDDIDGAREALEHVVARHGDVAFVWQQLGMLCLDTGDAERAIEAFRQWQRLDGPNADNEFALGWAYFVYLQPAKARQHVDSALALEPSDEIREFSDRLAALGDEAALESDAGWWLCGSGAVDRGSALLRHAAARRDDPVIKHRLGVALVIAGDTADAIPELRDAVAAEPTALDWLTDLGNAQLLVGDLDAADASFDRVSTADGLLGRGRVALCRHDAGRAMEVADEVIGADAELADAWMLRANALLALDRPAEAWSAPSMRSPSPPMIASHGHGGRHRRRRGRQQDRCPVPRPMRGCACRGAGDRRG